MNIAIDGPAGAGKSTVAQQIASTLGYVYIDTGAMYRALAWAAIEARISLQNEAAIAELVQTAQIELKRIDGAQHVFWKRQDITQEIRQPEVSNHASIVASHGMVRQLMLALQRNMAKQGNIVMDGRDIGTHVLPDAGLKIFLTASIEERAQRRYSELIAKGYDANLDQLKQEIAERDKRDSEREIAPLRQAEDAILVDTTGQTIEEVVHQILEISKRIGE